jgi:hypothetical protein
MKRLSVFILSLLLISDYILATDNKPYGLMTDLIEYTDKTWKNGFPTNIPVWEMDKSKDRLEFAAINSSYPSFSWIVPGTAPNTRQTFYHIIVSDSYEEAEALNGNIWNSGDIRSNQSTSVNYTGTELKPDMTYFWRVLSTVGNRNDSQWSDIKAFRTSGNLKEYKAAAYPLTKVAEYPVSINRTTSGSLMIDFGKASFGQLLITVSSKDGFDSLQIHLGEGIKDGKVDRAPGGTIRYHHYSLPLQKGKFTCRIQVSPDKRNTGANAILMPGYTGEVMPFRYCEIEGYNEPLDKTSVIRESVYYPFNDYASYFECSDNTLNRIWDLCKYSVKATSFTGIYVDGDRERIPYEADALINQLCHYGVDREYSMARNSYEYLLDKPTWPAEWILQALIIAWNDYMYTGDSRSLQANYDILKARTLMALKDKNGLISTITGLQTEAFKKSINRKDEEIKDIVDWPHTGILGLNKQEGGEADGFVFTDYNVVVNAYHYEAVRLMSRIAGELGKMEEASLFDNEANKFLSVFNKSFFNKKAGYYTDGVGEEHASLHGNMFPVAFGMVPAKNISSVLEFIRSRGMACSVYGSQFLMEALYDADNQDYALAMLTKTDDRGWYNMIRAGSTVSLEAWDNKYKPNQDWNHAWGAAPANIIPRKLVGVEPLAPGFDVVRIKPQISSLTWVKSKIPTVKGDITVEISQSADNYTLKFTLPSNMEAEVFLPVSTDKFEALKNGVAIVTKRQKGENFVNAGRVSSGEHVFTVRKSFP